MRSGEVAHSVSRGAFWLGLEKAAALFSGIAYSMLLLRWLGGSKFGIMTLALACTGFATAATLNLEMFLERFAAEYEARGQRATLRRAHLLALVVKTGLGVVAGAALIALIPRITAFYATAMIDAEMPVSELGDLLRVLTVLVVVDGLSTTGRATLYATQNFRWVALPPVFFHVAKAIMVGLLWRTGQPLTVLALGLSVLTAALALVQAAAPLWVLRGARDRDPPPPAERDARGLFRTMLAYCLPLLGARLTFMSGQNLSKLILGRLFEVRLLGYFTFAYQTIERFTELMSTVPASLLPSFTRLVARGEDERLRSALDQAQRLVQALGCVLSLFVFVFARELTVFIGGHLFEPAVPILRVLALVPLARTAQQPLTMLFQSMRRTGTVLGLSVIKFVTEFGCYLLLVLPLGILGAAWANLAGAVISYLAALLVLARIVPRGAGERAANAWKAVALIAPLLGLALLIDWRVREPVLLAGLHAALLLPAGVGLFLLGLVRGEDMERLASLPLHRPWTRVVRGSVLLLLGVFARLAHAQRA